MSFEYSSKLSDALDLDTLISRINDCGIVQGIKTRNTTNALMVGFKFNNVPDHSWEYDATMEAINENLYLTIHAGDAIQRESLISIIQHEMERLGTYVKFEEI